MNVQRIAKSVRTKARLAADRASQMAQWTKGELKRVESMTDQAIANEVLRQRVDRLALLGSQTLRAKG